MMLLMNFLMAVSTAPDLYLKDGTINVVTVVFLVEGLVQLFKPVTFDAWFNPSSQAHDSVIEISILFLTIAGVWVFQAYGPIGIHSGADILSMITQITTALLSEWGLYSKIRGGVPATPTAKYLTKLEKLPQ